MTKWVDFKEVKSRVSMEQVLHRYNVAVRKVNAGYCRGDCPLPQHKSDGKASFGVNTDKNIWSCQSASCAEARQGKKGGNVLDFVAWMERCSVREAAIKLAEWFDVNSAPPPQDQKKLKLVPQDGVANRPLAFTLKDIDHKHPYLDSRGFEEEECEFLGVGFFPGKGSMQGRIVFPIHNREGELVAYAGRSVEDAEPRWLFPAGFLKGQVLWNLHRVEEDDWTSVVVVESFWGVLACIRAGIMNSVALMSNHVTDEQAKLLSGFAHVTLLMDGDRYGKEATPGILEKLKSAGVQRVSVVSIEGCQPDDLTIDELRIALQAEEPELVPVRLADEVCA